MSINLSDQLCLLNDSEKIDSLPFVLCHTAKMTGCELAPPTFFSLWRGYIICYEMHTEDSLKLGWHQCIFGKLQMSFLFALCIRHAMTCKFLIIGDCLNACYVIICNSVLINIYYGCVVPNENIMYESLGLHCTGRVMTWLWKSIVAYQKVLLWGNVLVLEWLISWLLSWSVFLKKISNLKFSNLFSWVHWSTDRPHRGTFLRDVTETN